MATGCEVNWSLVRAQTPVRVWVAVTLTLARFFVLSIIRRRRRLLFVVAVVCVHTATT